MQRTPSNDLSKVPKLKDVTFRVRSQSIEWAIMALRTITPKHGDLRQISIYPSLYLITTARSSNGQTIEQTTYAQWSDFESLLVQFWESRSIRPRVTPATPTRGVRLRGFAECLLPEVTRRGIVDLLRSPYELV